MKIKVYFIRKKNEISDWESEYLKRINFRCSCEIMAINQAGIKEAEKAKSLEAEALLHRIGTNDFLVALDEKGKSLDSIEFSQWTKKQLETFGTIHLVIGGAHGLDEKILMRANAKIRFGKMVWTRNLVRLMALEQLYRALEIDGGGNFHKK